MTPPLSEDDSWAAFCVAISRAWAVSRWGSVGVVVGCSGGADSVALLRALCELRSHRLPDACQGFIVAAHLNHGIRGDESDGDQAFVRELADELGVDFLTDNVVGDPSTDEDSLRRFRMSFLRQQAERIGARYVALGHTADDNIETVLHHLFRGTGPAGLAGIAPHRSLGQDLVLTRPMLSITRRVVREVLDSVGQRWREDSSNQNGDYRRNWIRHELIPLVRSKYPDAENAMARAARSQREWRSVIDSLADDWRDRHLISADPLELGRDASTDSCIVIAALQQIWTEQGWPQRAMTMRHWQQLYNSINAASDTVDRYQMPGGIDVCCAERGVVLDATSLRRSP
ncbi:tRNA lysidine(34) synthetase TilS [Novipirellula artificiosorum]|nr:tRNA lysidine(34) synthetase TilS [Novipirellula artificiosorum]